MSDERLHALLRQTEERQASPETFDDVMAASRRRWRLRRVRAAIAAALLVALSFAAFRDGRETGPQFAELALPPTTDWLLETPPPDWLTRASAPDNEEKTYAN